MYPEHSLAEETTKDELPDRFMIRGGANFIWNADTNMSLSGSRGVGGIFNYGDVLKGDETATVPRVDAYFRFNPNHSIGFTYYRVGRDGLNAIDLSIDFGNVTFPIGAAVQSPSALQREGDFLAAVGSGVVCSKMEFTYSKWVLLSLYRVDKEEQDAFLLMAVRHDTRRVRVFDERARSGRPEEAEHPRHLGG